MAGWRKSKHRPKRRADKERLGFDGQVILSHLIGWLQMGYTPEGLDEEQMERFENQIESWVEEYKKTLRSASDF